MNWKKFYSCYLFKKKKAATTYDEFVLNIDRFSIFIPARGLFYGFYALQRDWCSKREEKLLKPQWQAIKVERNAKSKAPEATLSELS